SFIACSAALWSSMEPPHSRAVPALPHATFARLSVHAPEPSGSGVPERHERSSIRPAFVHAWSPVSDGSRCSADAVATAPRGTEGGTPIVDGAATPPLPACVAPR